MAPRRVRSSTHANAFDADVFLRIAPELFLKRAVVGGIDRVFEINRNFRNEGADSTHSPEFAMLEAYQSYSDYNGIADLTQELIQNAARRGRGLHHGDVGRRHRVRPRRSVGPHLDVRLPLGGIRPADHARDADRGAGRVRGGARRARAAAPDARQVGRGAVGALREGRTSRAPRS